MGLRGLGLKNWELDFFYIKISMAKPSLLFMDFNEILGFEPSQVLRHLFLLTLYNFEISEITYIMVFEKLILNIFILTKACECFICAYSSLSAPFENIFKHVLYVSFLANESFSESQDRFTQKAEKCHVSFSKIGARLK